MSAPAEHPLETLYHARDALEAAVNAVREQTTAQVSDELCCYAAVDTSILYEFRHLVSVLMTKLDTSRPAVYAAHGEMHEIINMFDQVIGYIERHGSRLASRARRRSGPVSAAASKKTHCCTFGWPGARLSSSNKKFSDDGPP